MKYPNYLGKDGQERMVRNGWTLRVCQPKESYEDLYNRLSETYTQVKVYYCGTMIRGIHSYFAMCKGYAPKSLRD